MVDAAATSRRGFIAGSAAALALPALASATEAPGPIERAYKEHRRRDAKRFPGRDMTQADHDWVDEPLMADEIDHLPTSQREWAALLLLVYEEFGPDSGWDIDELLGRVRAAIAVPEVSV